MTHLAVALAFVVGVISVTPSWVTAGGWAASGMVEPDLHQGVLSNGMRVAVRERPGAEVVAISVGIRGGSRVEDDATLGAAHFMEHMFFQGTPRRPDSIDIDRELEALGGWANAWTGIESINFQVVVPIDGFDLALDVVSDMLVNSSFDPNKVEKERRVVLAELNRRSASPAQRAYDTFWTELFADHPARRQPGGSRETVNTISLETLLLYRDTYFVASNMVIAVVGDVDHELVFSKAEAAFGDQRTGPRPPLEAVARPDEAARRAEMTPIGQQARLIVGSAVAGRGDPDRYALRLIAAVLGPAGRRLRTEVIDRRSLAGSLAVRYQEMSDVGVWLVEGVTSPASVDELVDSILTVSRQLADTPLEPNELAEAKRFVRGSRLLARERSVDLAVELSDGLVLDYYEPVETYLARIDAVSAEDIQRVARIYLDPARQLTVVPRR